MPGDLHLAQDQADSAWTKRTARAIRVVLADDHTMMRRTLRLLLESEDDLEVIAESGDLETAMRHVRERCPQVLALDLGMPNGSSIEAIRRLREELPGTEIVVLSMEESPVFARQAVDAGAIGFVLKDMADEDLPEAVRRAASGLHYVSPRVAASLTALLRSRTDDRLGGREPEVVRLIALGYTSAEVACELHLSKRTVETHRERINRKLGVRTRRELVSYALRQGLLAA
jgi:two-component system response regulator NreC